MSIGGSYRGNTPTAAYLAETNTIAAAFSTPPTKVRKDLIEMVVGTLKASGVWASLDVFHMFAAADSQASLINWVNPGTNDATVTIAAVSVIFTADSGHATDGTSGFIDSTVNASTATNFLQDSCCMGIYCLTNAQTSTFPIGEHDGTDSVLIWPRSTVDQAQIRMNQTASVNIGNTDSSGMFSANRSASNAIQFFRNGASLTTGSNASVAPNNLTLRIGTTNASTFAAISAACFYAGGSLGSTVTKHFAVHSVVLKYLTAVGAV